MTRFHKPAAPRNGEHGIAAVEFGIIFPVLLMLFFVVVNLSQYVSLNRKLTVAANLVADLVTRQKEVTQADIDDYILAAQMSLRPLDASKVRIDIHRYTKASGASDWTKSSTGGVACSAPSKVNYNTLLDATDVVVAVVCMSSFDAPGRVSSPSAVGNFFQIFAPPRQEVVMRPRLGTTLKFCSTSGTTTTCV